MTVFGTSMPPGAEERIFHIGLERWPPPEVEFNDDELRAVKLDRIGAVEEALEVFGGVRAALRAGVLEPVDRVSDRLRWVEEDSYVRVVGTGDVLGGAPVEVGEAEAAV